MLCGHDLTLGDGPGSVLDPGRELSKSLALDSPRPRGPVIQGDESALSIVEESPLAVHKPIEPGSVCLLMKEVDAVVGNSRRVVAFEAKLLDQYGIGVEPSEEHSTYR